jgi:hypothetical protein
MSDVVINIEPLKPENQWVTKGIPYAIGWADDETGDYLLKIDKQQIKTVKTESETETELVLRLIPKPA